MKRCAIILVLLLSSCTPASGGNETATHAIDTYTPEVTQTSVPATRVPPTPTVTPPEILHDYLVDPVVDSLMTFDSPPKGFSLDGVITGIEGGQLYIRGEEYRAGVKMPSAFSEGTGIVFNFKIMAPAPPKFEFDAHFGKGYWGTPEYRRFGVYIMQAPQTNKWTGQKLSWKYLNGNLSIEEDIWYRMLLAVGEGADFLAVITDPAQPDSIRNYRLPQGGDWSGLDWSFELSGAQGLMKVDDMMEISFSAIR